MAARFWERRPGFALSLALVTATSVSTLFSLFWPFPADEAKEINMSHLVDGGLGALFVWIYCIIWFVAQDAIKVGTYYLLRKLQIGQTKDMDVRLTSGVHVHVEKSSGHGHDHGHGHGHGHGHSHGHAEAAAPTGQCVSNLLLWVHDHAGRYVERPSVRRVVR